MIYIGLNENKKTEIVQDYIDANNIEKVFVVGKEIDGDFGVPLDYVNYAHCIDYVNYYRFLQGIDSNSLFIFNDAMQTRNRSGLNYNCCRRYAQQTSHRLIFSPLPLIDDKNDFLILWDLTQKNPFLRQLWEEIESFVGVEFSDDVMPKIEVVYSELTDEQLAQYAKIKEEAIAEVKRDASIIPSRLLRFSEKMNAKNTKQKFDSKIKIKSRMRICVNQTGVDKYYEQYLQQIVKEIENVKLKIQ